MTVISLDTSRGSGRLTDEQKIVTYQMNYDDGAGSVCCRRLIYRTLFIDISFVLL